MDSLLSIGVPVRNGAQYLEETVRSALGQQRISLEVIISDNASTDQTLAIATRLAATDPRVRVVTAQTNQGVTANYRRVLREARGRYFTWLAHDDLVADPEYAATLVGYLDAHPDVACAVTPVELRDVSTNVSTLIGMSDLRPEGDWLAAQRALYSWPQRETCYAIYGVFRRAALEQAPIRSMRIGRRHFFADMPMLATVVHYGRVVAIPGPPRTLRLRSDSLGQRILQTVSPFDQIWIGFAVKTALIRCAIGAPDWWTRWELLTVALANLTRANLTRPWDYEQQTRVLEREHAMLVDVAEERLAVLARGGGQPSVAVRATGRPDRPPPAPAVLGFFRPPSPETVAYYRWLSADVARLRDVCDDLLARINAQST